MFSVFAVNNHQLKRNFFLEGIFPDLLHIADLQIVPDSVVSTLWELAEKEPARERESFLSQLRNKYESWCRENSS